MTTTTGEKVQGAIDGTKETAKVVINKAEALTRAVGKTVKKEANEVGKKAEHIVEAIGHQVTGTPTNATPTNK